VKKSSYMRIKRTMPTAAIACLPAKSLGFSWDSSRREERVSDLFWFLEDFCQLVSRSWCQLTKQRRREIRRGRRRVRFGFGVVYGVEVGGGEDIR